MFQTAGTEEYGAFHLTPSEGPLAPITRVTTVTWLQATYSLPEKRRPSRLGVTGALR